MFESVFRRLQLFGEIVIDIIKTIFVQRGKSATGSTLQSLRQETVFETQQGAELKVIGSKVFDYIESGRPAGSKLPPEGALISWMQSRGIPAEKEFAVRKSIAQKGIKPEPIIELAFIQVQREAQSLSQEILNELTKTVIEAVRAGFSFS